MKHHVFHPEAAAEYDAALESYQAIDAFLGLRFFTQIEDVILQVRRNAEWFWQFDPPARRHFSKDFPYAVIYLDQPDLVWIVAIMHMKREPGYWRNRLAD